jgi:hypothetical protein
MERMHVVRRALIAKLSKIHLMVNLYQADVDGEAVDAMDREQLIDAWSDLVATGKGAGAMPVATASSDPTEFDWEMLAYEEGCFEKRRFEAELALELEFPGAVDRMRADVADRAERRKAAAAAREATERVAFARWEAANVVNSQVTQVVPSEPMFPIKPPCGATGSSMTVETDMDRPVNQSVTTTVMCNHVAIDEIDAAMTVSEMKDKSITVDGGDINTAGVSYTKNVVRLAELKLIEFNVGFDGNKVWRGTDDASSELNVVSKGRVVALVVPSINNDAESRDAGDLVAPIPVMVSVCVTRVPADRAGKP